jgi:protein gp37
MAETTIEWTRGPNGEPGFTFNPWIGCTKVSLGCDNCYAARQDAHRRWTPEGWGGPRRRTKTWGDPVKWNAQAEREGRRFRVFCASLADVFDNQVPSLWRRELFELIARTPQLDWLLLTKRIGNAAQMLDDVIEEMSEGINIWSDMPWPNIWLGATVVNQEEADRDIPKLLAVPARVRFLSIEPMLGPIDLTDVTLRRGTGDEEHFDALHFDGDADDEPELGTATLDWIIAGGESGPHARPVHPDWARSLRDQCAAAGVPFLWKQWGEHSLEYDRDRDDPDYRRCDRMARLPGRWINLAGGHGFNGERVHYAHKVGKKAAGRLLDGIEHNGAPTP